MRFGDTFLSVTPVIECYCVTSKQPKEAVNEEPGSDL